MMIRAKYAGRCATCGGAVRVGDTIEWARGAPTRHAMCPASGEAPTARSPGGERRGRCAYCGRDDVPVRHEPCHEPCPESAVPGSLWESCDRRHAICADGCTPYSAAEIEARRVRTEQVHDAHRAQETAQAVINAFAVLAESAGLAAVDAAREEARGAGLVRVCGGHAGTGERTVVYSGQNGFYTCTVAWIVRADGTRVLDDSAYGYDDDRPAAWLPVAEAEARWAAWAARVGMTRAEAREWLGRYDGCEGDDAYHWAAEHGPSIRPGPSSCAPEK